MAGEREFERAQEMLGDLDPPLVAGLIEGGKDLVAQPPRMFRHGSLLR